MYGLPPAKANACVLQDILSGGMERAIVQSDMDQALQLMTPSTVEWLKTARNLVRYAGSDDSYRDVEKYLKQTKYI